MKKSCECEKSKLDKGKKIMHSLSIEQQEAVHFLLVDSRKPQEFACTMGLFLIGLGVGMLIAANIILMALV